VKSLICTISYKFYDSSFTYLQTCSSKLYYVVHKFSNISRTMIQLGTHAHLVANDKCRESFQEMKNMLEDEICHTPTTTTLTIALFMNKTFLFLSLVQRGWTRSYGAFQRWKTRSNVIKVCCFLLPCHTQFHYFTEASS
jgi:hypothetical protein